VVGGVTVIGAFGFLEYALSLVYVLTVGILIAVALIAAIVLCSVAFREATEQAVVLRNVTVLSVFAWVGLAFIAAYHIVWLVFVLTLISIWPLKAISAK
jgi:predicted ATP-dependent Lon-type protease